MVLQLYFCLDSAMCELKWDKAPNQIEEIGCDS